MKHLSLASLAPLVLVSSHAAGRQCDPSWSPLGAGVNSVVRAIKIFDADASGPAQPGLIVGGFFTQAGGAPANRIARWDGSAWSTLGLGTNSQVSALAIFNEDGAEGVAPALFAGGFFTTADGLPASHVARWDGNSWSALDGGVGAGLDEVVTSLAVFDEDGPGPAQSILVAGGFFFQAGGLPAENLARWDGTTWTEFGGGTNGTVTSLAVFDLDGDGVDELYVGGFFNLIDDVAANNIARWEQGTWSALGSGTNGTIDDIVLAPGVEPATLIMGGNFTIAGDMLVNYVASWDGRQWKGLAGGFDFNVLALATFDEDGSGPLPEALYACGNFTSADGTVVNQVARWDGRSWSDLDGGANSQVSALLSDQDGAVVAGAPRLYAGGFFTIAGGIAADHIGAWVGCAAPSLIGDLNGDGVVEAADLVILIGAWGTCLDCPTDLDGNGEVGGADLALLLGAWS